MTAARLLSGGAVALVITAAAVLACSKATGVAARRLSASVAIQSAASTDCVQVTPAPDAGAPLIGRICFGPREGDVRPVSVVVGSPVGCVRVSERGGSDLAFAEVDDKPERDLVEVAPAGLQAVFAMAAQKVTIGPMPDGGGRRPIDISIERTTIEAFARPCWKICNARRGELIVELGGGADEVAYSPGQQMECSVLGPMAFARPDRGTNPPGARAADAGAVDADALNAGAAAGAGH